MADSNRQSQIEGYLRERRISRASLSRHDLAKHTDVKCFVSSNFANLVSFVAVVGVTFCLGWMGWGRDVRGSYLEISAKYETPLTPIYWFIPATWTFLFISEAIFITFSFLNSYSHISIIQDGVGFYLFFANLCHLGWIISYCFDMIWVSVIWMVLYVLLIFRLNQNVYNQGHINEAPRFLDQQTTLRTFSESDGEGEPMTVVYEWLVFRLPFQLHLGWIIYVLLLNINEMAVYSGWGNLSELTLVSLIVLWVLGLFVLFYPKYPVFAIPLVISWATVGVWINLLEPSKIMMELYDPKTIAQVKGGIIATCFEHAVIAFIRFIYFLANSYSLMIKDNM